MALEQDDDEDMSETREEPPDDEDEDTSTVGSSTDPLVSIDNAHTDSENEEGDAPLGGEPGSIAMGDTIECGGLEWKRVLSMGVDVREAKGEFDLQFKDSNMHDGAAEVEIFDELFPVDREWMLEVVVVRGRAAEANDKHRNNWHEHHIDGFLTCMFGGTQFKPQTDLWSPERKWMMPPPGFGRHLSIFRRADLTVCCGAFRVDPWAQRTTWGVMRGRNEVRYWVDGHDKVRKAKLRAGSKVTPDEDMLWLGWAQMTAAVRSL
jgi:hypothetical protein